MPIRKVKPITNGQRGLSYVDTSDITRKAPEKRLVAGLRKSGGRNNVGRMTVRRRGGGHKRLYRFVDFRRSELGKGVKSELAALVGAGRSYHARRIGLPPLKATIARASALKSFDRQGREIRVIGF